MNALYDQKRLLYKIARDYYLNQLTQNEIAKRLGLSRIKVSRLLRQARQENVVSITLNTPPGLQADLEEALENRFGLEEVNVVICENASNQSTIVAELASAAVECLLRRVSGDEIIGVAMGKTMMSVVHTLPTRALPNLKIVQMNGGLGHVVTLEQSAELARQMAAKLSAELHLLHAPGIAADKQAAVFFKNDPLNAGTLALAVRADIAMLSIGRMAAGATAWRDLFGLSAADIAHFDENSIVGDIALRYIDAAGQHVRTPLDERIIGLSFEELQKIPCVIAVAGGDEKREVIRAALKTGIPNVLVTDQKTAEFLLNV